MQLLSHDSLKSSKDVNGNQHRVCLDRFSCCSRNKNITTFVGKRFSFSECKHADPRHETYCTAKVPNSRRATKEWALGEIEKSKKAQISAEIFVRSLNDSGKKITFILPQSAELDTVAILSNLRVGDFILFEDTQPNFTHFVDIEGKLVADQCIRHSKRRSSRRRKSQTSESELHSSCQDENLENAIAAQDMNYLVPTCPPYESDNPPSYDEVCGSNGNQTNQFQDIYMNVNYVNCNPVEPAVNLNNVYNCNIVSNTHFCPGIAPRYTVGSGSDVTNCDNDESDNLPHPLLRAFIHADFYQSVGQRVITNLKGSCTNGVKYTLTTPTFHSLYRTFGERDMGEQMIKKVIDNHVCSRWCRSLPRMIDIYRHAKISYSSLHFTNN